MNSVLKEDINEFVRTFELANELKEASFLITGATGLIGSSLIHCLLALSNGIRIVAPVRDKAKALAMFQEEAKLVEWIECDLREYNYKSIGYVDYIIHCAAPTASRYFIEYPVETIDIIYQATHNLLKYAKENRVVGMVYLSSLEVYGAGLPNDEWLDEAQQGYWNPMHIRSSYPLAKRLVENLCCSYFKEYNIPIMVARLTQTTGAGVDKNDNRVIAQFAKLAAENSDIVLHSTGESARPYCYTMDCVSAILYLLLRGKRGDIYNIANSETYVSAKEMAEFLKENFSPSISVSIELDDSMGYAPVSRLKLSTNKLQSLGWSPRYDLKMIFERLITYYNEEA